MHVESSKHIPKPPDGGWGWVVVFASFMVHVIADGVAYTFGLFFVEISKEFGNKAQTSMIASIMGGITYCIGPIAGALVNKYGCRPVSIAGSIVGAIGFATSYYASSNAYLFLSIGVLGGIGLGLIYLPAIVSVTCYFEKKRAFATGIAVCGSGFGTFLLTPFMEYLITELQWRGALLATSGIILNCVIFSALFRPVPTEQTEEVDEEVAIQEGVEVEKSVPQIVEPNVLDENDIDILYKKSRSDSKSVESEEPLLSPGSRSPPDLIKNAKHTTTDKSNVALPNSISSNVTSPSHLINLSPNKDTLTMSVSHPVLPVGLIGSSDSLHKFRGRHKRHSLKFASDVLFETPATSKPTLSAASSGIIFSRKDIFYSGSAANISNIPEIQGESSNNSEDDSFTQKFARSPEDSADLVFSKRICGIPCSPEIHQVFKTMMDISILRNPVFLIFALSNFFTSIGYSCPYIFLKDKAIENHAIDDSSAGFLIAIIGISNTLSRILLGYLSDKAWMNRLYLYNVALMLCGLATGLVGHTDQLPWLQTYAATFGATVGVYVSLTSVILVDLLGLDKLTNAFGFLLLFQGIATLIGPPMIGALYDEFHDYRLGFWLAGGMILLSGLMLFVIPCVERKYLANKKSSVKLINDKNSQRPESRIATTNVNANKSIIFEEQNDDGLRRSPKLITNHHNSLTNV